MKATLAARPDETLTTGASTVFIVGAGFSLEANATRSSWAIERSVTYPTLADLAETCFTPPVRLEDVEREFKSRYWRRKQKALRKLADLIGAADREIGRVEARSPESVYHRLLNVYPSSHFISFNYDSLLELVLTQRREWFPHDGFGIRVEVGHSSAQGPISAPSQSKHIVMHLHGSIRLYSSILEFHNGWLSSRPTPLSFYDPGDLEFWLGPFSRVTPDMIRKKWRARYEPPEDRFIPPVPNKGEFVQAPGFTGHFPGILKRAQTMLSKAQGVIAIGYRFADSDSESWLPLLQTIVTAEITLLIVAPDAHEIVTRLANRVTNLRVRGIGTTLGGWTNSGFKG
jgi:hypothetical protein